MNEYTIVDNGLYQDYDYLSSVIDATLKHEKVEGSVFSVVFVSLEEIHQMNLSYRGIDRPTDVISFALEDGEEDASFFGVRTLGDIYVCIDRMKEQAISYGHSQKRELSFLVCHGLLHLLGYDHMEQEEEKVMFGLQEEILNGLGITR